MKQLIVADVLKLISQLKQSGMNDQELLTLPIYIGDDDELNGIHCAWFSQMIDSNNPEGDDQEFLTIINERSSNYPLTGKAILIS